MKSQMIRVISSPSSSTTGLATLIFGHGLSLRRSALQRNSGARLSSRQPRPGKAGIRPYTGLFRRQAADEVEREAHQPAAQGRIGDGLGVHVDEARHRPAGHRHAGARAVAPAPRPRGALPTRYMPPARWVPQSMLPFIRKQSPPNIFLSLMPDRPSERRADRRAPVPRRRPPVPSLVRSRGRAYHAGVRRGRARGGGHGSRARRRSRAAAGLRARRAADGREHRRRRARDAELRPRPPAPRRPARRLAEPARRGDGERRGPGARRRAGRRRPPPRPAPTSTCVFATTARDRALTKLGADPRARHGRGAGDGRRRRAGRRAVRPRARRARDRRRRARQRGGLGAGEPGLRLAQPGAMRAARRLRMAARGRRDAGRADYRLAGARRASGIEVDRLRRPPRRAAGRGRLLLPRRRSGRA